MAIAGRSFTRDFDWPHHRVPIAVPPQISQIKLGELWWTLDGILFLRPVLVSKISFVAKNSLASEDISSGWPKAINIPAIR
jgi:hypothetical protein